MKAIFIAYNQAFNMELADALETIDCKGFTMWNEISGRGSETGEPHLGNHAWPTLNNAMLTVLDDAKVDAAMEILDSKNKEYPQLGLRAFVFNIEKAL